MVYYHLTFSFRHFTSTSQLARDIASNLREEKEKLQAINSRHKIDLQFLSLSLLWNKFHHISNFTPLLTLTKKYKFIYARCGSIILTSDDIMSDGYLEKYFRKKILTLLFHRGWCTMPNKALHHIIYKVDNNKK